VSRQGGPVVIGATRKSNVSIGAVRPLALAQQKTKKIVFVVIVQRKVADHHWGEGVI